MSMRRVVDCVSIEATPVEKYVTKAICNSYPKKKNYRHAAKESSEFSSVATLFVITKRRRKNRQLLSPYRRVSSPADDEERNSWKSQHKHVRVEKRQETRDTHRIHYRCFVFSARLAPYISPASAVVGRGMCYTQPCCRCCPYKAHPSS